MLLLDLMNDMQSSKKCNVISIKLFYVINIKTHNFDTIYLTNKKTYKVFYAFFSFKITKFI